MASEKNKAMNARVDAYLRILPEKMVLMESKTGEDEPAGVASGPPSPHDSSGDDLDSGSQSGGQGEAKGGLMKRVKKQSKRLSLGLFR